MIELFTDTIETPVGEVYIVSNGTELCALDYEGYETRMHALLQQRYGEHTLTRVRDPLGASTRVRAYFDGDFSAIHTLPVRLDGTEFQQRVWAELRAIPPGRVRSYGEIAAKLGQPTASRAVGAANGRNPVAIVVPCHRVVGANSALTGYAGGMERKEWLLAHEGIVL